MSPVLWVAGVGAAMIFFGVVQIGVRKLIERMGRRLDREPDGDPESWESMIVERHRAEATSFDADIVYWAWPILLFNGFAIAAAIGGWGFGWVVFGFVFGAFALAVLLARIKYGSSKMRDVKRLLMREPRSSRPIRRGE
jgi:hypothetical protein